MYTGRKTPMYIVRSLSMTNWLCNNGFKILKVEDSEKDDRLKVFLFEDTPALHGMMMKYRKRKRV
ncbi:MAG: DUF5659 domain-containing protein [Mediterraneibacter faecis]